MPQDKHAASAESALASPSRIRKRKHRSRLVAGALLLAAGGAWYWMQGEEQGPVSQPLIATVEIGSIENTIPAAGTIKPSNFVDVGAQVSGQLQQIYVEVGDVVEQGQLLAEIDARVQQNRVDSSRASIEAQEAQLEARKAALELARANFERQERLMAADATSQQDYDTARNNLTSAEASLIQQEKSIEQARASLSSDETQLEFTRIYAPVAGTVVSIAMNEGRTLNASQQAPTILTIADLNLMTVEAEISEADIGSIKKGMEVYFTTLGSGSRRWYGTLRQIRPTPTVTNNVVLYTGLFDVENSDGTLLPEMTAQVFFVSSSAENVVTAPLGALTFNEAPPAAEMAARAQRIAGMSTAAPDDERRQEAGAVRAGGRAPQGQPPGGGFPSGEFPGAFPNGGGQRGAMAGGGNGARRLATVQVVKDDGTRETREIIVGVTSRISAEIVSGLQVGEQVIAGILQGPPVQADNDNGFRGNFRMRGF